MGASTAGLLPHLLVPHAFERPGVTFEELVLFWCNILMEETEVFSTEPHTAHPWTLLTLS